MGAWHGAESMMIIHDWLEDRVAERRFNILPSDDALEFAMLAGVLRAEAQSAGYSPETLEAACGGDLCNYLMRYTQIVETSAA